MFFMYFSLVAIGSCCHEANLIFSLIFLLKSLLPLVSFHASLKALYKHLQFAECFLPPIFIILIFCEFYCSSFPYWGLMTQQQNKITNRDQSHLLLGSLAI